MTSHNKTALVTIRMEPSEVQAIEQLAKELDRPKSYVIRQLVKEALALRKRKR